MSKVEQVKGVQFNYVNFLWKGISKIWDLQQQGDHITGVEVAINFVDYLPEDIQNKHEFQKKAQEMQTRVKLARKTVNHSDIFITNVSRNRYLQNVAKQLLKDFVRELCVLLSKRGYMEKVSKPVPSNVPPEFFDQVTR